MDLAWLAVIIVVCTLGIMMGINILSERYDKIIELLKHIKEHQDGKKEEVSSRPRL